MVTLEETSLFSISELCIVRLDYADKKIYNLDETRKNLIKAGNRSRMKATHLKTLEGIQIRPLSPMV